MGGSIALQSSVCMPCRGQIPAYNVGVPLLFARAIPPLLKRVGALHLHAWHAPPFILLLMHADESRGGDLLYVTCSLTTLYGAAGAPLQLYGGKECDRT